ncbi:MAG: glutamine-hydrolyzing GMP synthase, partial [bacterium]|nr:glutamine-hydrolyzing GMP synthase [bacterium]
MIAIVDFGSQFTHVIARRIRSLDVKTEVFRFNVNAEQLKASDGIIFSGGPSSVYANGAPNADPAIYRLGKPILGICYGMQLFGHQLGGKVDPGKTKEYGSATIRTKGRSVFFRGIPTQTQVWMSHGDRVAKLPPGFVVTAKTSDVPVVAMEDTTRQLFAVQFHPEVSHTQHGSMMLKNFIEDICHAKKDWQLGDVMNQTIQTIRDQIGKEYALCGLSGGVDSSVAAVLVHRAIGKHLTCVFIDHGMLRKDETGSVRKAFGQHFNANLRT